MRRFLFGLFSFVLGTIFIGGGVTLCGAGYLFGGVAGLIGAMALVAVTVVLPAARKIQAPNFGVEILFGKRTGRILEEGLRFTIPYFSSVELFSHEMISMLIKVSVWSKDKLEIIITGTVQWRADKQLAAKTFFEMSESAVKDGLLDAIKGELGVIAGTYNGDAFIKQREAIGLLINCVLRMAQPFHWAAVKAGETKDMPASKRLKYYQENAAVTRDHLEMEPSLTNDRSALEKRYGVDVLSFNLSDVDFSQETKKKMESKQQEKASLEAKDLQHKAKLDYANDYKNRIGLDPQAAMNSAEVTVGQATKQVFSVEGLGLDKLVGPIKKAIGGFYGP